MSKLKTVDRANTVDLSPAALARHKPSSSGVDLGLVAPRSAIHTQFEESTSPVAKENRMLKDRLDLMTVQNVELKNSRDSSAGKLVKLESQVEILAAKVEDFDGSLPTRKLDPTTIKSSEWANRHQDSFLGQEFTELKKEIFEAGGNIQAIKVRRLSSPSDAFLYEIVFGHRRHRACLELGISVLAVIEEVNDEDLFVQMDRENKQRADLRPYEQATMYKRALDKKLFKNSAELSRATGTSQGNLSTLLSLVGMPNVVLDAFESRLDITFNWTRELIILMKAIPEPMLLKAKEIIAKRGRGEIISSSDVADQFLRLLRDPIPPSVPVADVIEPVVDKAVTPPKKVDKRLREPARFIKVNGVSVASIKTTRKSFVVEIQKEQLDTSKIKALEVALSKILGK